MQLNDLAGKSVAVWGAGREATAFVHAVRALNVDVAISILDEHPEPQQTVEGISVTLFSIDELRATDFVLRSPGISVYRPELQGLSVITATGLWFSEPHAKVVAVTGTKGKSTTSSLIAHVLNGIGVKTQLAGNIGRSPLDFVGSPEPDAWVVELSSFQISDSGAEPDIAVLTSLDSDHLDWHGDQEHYVNDKLRLFEKAHLSIVNGIDPGARAVIDRLNNVVVVDDSTPVPPSQLFGAHNAQLIRLALSAVAAMGIDLDANADRIAEAIANFAPLPHRLEPVAEVNGVLYINDSLSTNPIAATAAVKTFVGRPISLLLGGYDRGLNFDDLAAFLTTVPDLHIYTLPDCGERIVASVRESVRVTPTNGMVDAIKRAADETPSGGVVLLAPAAASFSEFGSYAERGEVFRSTVSALSDL